MKSYYWVRGGCLAGKGKVCCVVRARVRKLIFVKRWLAVGLKSCVIWQYVFLIKSISVV